MEGGNEYIGKCVRDGRLREGKITRTVLWRKYLKEEYKNDIFCREGVYIDIF